MVAVIALITLFKGTAYDRHKPIYSGLYPVHQFEGVEHMIGGLHTYDDDEPHYPGETIQAIIEFRCWPFDKPLMVGDTFTIHEAKEAWGRGIIQEVSYPLN